MRTLQYFLTKFIFIFAVSSLCYALDIENLPIQIPKMYEQGMVHKKFEIKNVNPNNASYIEDYYFHRYVGTGIVSLHITMIGGHLAQYFLNPVAEKKVLLTPMYVELKNYRGFIAGGTPIDLRKLPNIDKQIKTKILGKNVYQYLGFSQSAVTVEGFSIYAHHQGYIFILTSTFPNTELVRNERNEFIKRLAAANFH